MDPSNRPSAGTSERVSSDRVLYTKIERWLRASRGKESPAIILGSSANGLSFARSLGRRGIPVLMLDSDRLFGAYTRYGRFLQLPSTEEYPHVWIDFLEFVGSRLEAPAILFPTSDAHCLLVSQQKNILRRYFRFLLPEAEAVEQIVNKRFQYEIAQAAGIPIPRTYFPESVEEMRCLSSRVPYPCLLKPYQSHIGRKRLSKKKLLVVYSEAELIAAYERITAGDVPFMVQEIVPGEDNSLYGYIAFWDSEGHELAWVTKKKLRQYPPGYGDGSLQMTVAAPEVAELSRRLLGNFNYRGFGYVEFKLDARDRNYRLIEINPRTPACNQMAISAGVDLPWLGYQYLAGDYAATESNKGFQSGVKYLNEEWDIQAYLTLRKSGALNFWSWFRSLRGIKARAIGAPDDLFPFVIGLWRAVEVLCQNLWSAVRKRGKC